MNHQKNGDEDVSMRAPTTAQRRQMFQDRINSVTEAPGSVVDGNTSSSSIVGASPIPKRVPRAFGI